MSMEATALTGITLASFIIESGFRRMKRRQPMRVAEIMTTDVQTVRPEARASEARELMRRHGIHHLVVMEKARVVGVISDRDAGRRKGAGDEALVEDLMTHSVVTVPPEETI